MDALAAAHDGAVQMIDTSIVRVHQHAACIGVLCSKVVELEQIANEPSGTFGNHDAVWLCNALQGLWSMVDVSA
jgi:hypothetical protein